MPTPTPHPIALESRRAHTIKVCMTIPNDVLRRARAIARKHNVSLSSYVTKLLDLDIAARDLAEEIERTLTEEPQKRRAA